MSPMQRLCEDLAGLGPGPGARAWLRAQVGCWAFLVAVTVHSAHRWAAHWGSPHRHGVIVLGSCKTFGFMLMDVVAIAALLLAQRGVERPRAKGGLEERAEARLEEKAQSLLVSGFVLAAVEGAHWVLWLWDQRLRRQRLLVASMASACVVLTKPGLMCAFLPALAGREEAQLIVEELLAEVRGGKLDWDELLIRYARAEARISELAARSSPAVGCLLLALLLGALLHGVAVWFWVERLSFVPSAAVNVNYALAALYGLLFLRSYFAFTGFGALHGQLVGSVAGRLRECPPGEVEKVVQAFHYLRARSLRWSLHVGPGKLDLDELKGRYLSVAFVGNLGAKLVPRLRRPPAAAGAPAPARPGAPRAFACPPALAAPAPRAAAGRAPSAPGGAVARAPPPWPSAAAAALLWRRLAARSRPAA